MAQKQKSYHEAMAKLQTALHASVTGPHESHVKGGGGVLLKQENQNNLGKIVNELQYKNLLMVICALSDTHFSVIRNCAKEKLGLLHDAMNEERKQAFVQSSSRFWDSKLGILRPRGDNSYYKQEVTERHLKHACMCLFSGRLDKLRENFEVFKGPRGKEIKWTILRRPPRLGIVPHRHEPEMRAIDNTVRLLCPDLKIVTGGREGPIVERPEIVWKLGWEVKKDDPYFHTNMRDGSRPGDNQKSPLSKRQQKKLLHARKSPSRPPQQGYIETEFIIQLGPLSNRITNERVKDAWAACDEFKGTTYWELILTAFNDIYLQELYTATKRFFF